MRKARSAEILELGKKREDVLDARTNGADAIREAAREHPACDLAERAGPAGRGAHEHAAVYAQVGDGGEKGGDGAEGRERVAKLDREAADGGAVDVAQVRREVRREEEEVAERLEAQFRAWAWAAARDAERAHEGEVRDGEVFQVGEGTVAQRHVVRVGPGERLDARVRLEEALRVLVRVEGPAPAQVELDEGGESAVVEQGRNVGAVADEMR